MCEQIFVEWIQIFVPCWLPLCLHCKFGKADKVSRLRGYNTYTRKREIYKFVRIATGICEIC